MKYWIRFTPGKRVLQLRFGLEDGKQRTLEEVGKEFGVTRERSARSKPSHPQAETPTRLKIKRLSGINFRQ